MSRNTSKKQQFRNENGFGSIVKLSGNRRKPYAVRITTGWKDGKQQRKYVGYYQSQKEALVALAEYHKNGVDVDLTKLTLKEVWARWIVKVENKNLSKSVLKNHNSTYKHLGKLLNMKMRDIKTAHLQSWMDNIDLKPGTKGKLKSSMSQVFEYALQNDIVTKNYAAFIEINEKVEKTGSIFTDEEIKLIWDNVENDTAQQLLILIYTGMRIGELLAVNRDHINFEEGYIIGGSKTEAGKDRVIPLHNKILPLVKNQLKDNAWLVQSNRGLAMSYPHASRQFNSLFDKLGFNHKIHDTRKTSVSLMHSAGIPMETIRVIVGHSGKGVTEKVYLYKEPKELVEVINTMKIPYDM